MATELGKAFVQIVPSARGISGSISSALSGESISAGKRAGSSIVSGIKAAILTAGIGKVLSSALGEGAKLQQSIGGIETLYKKSADKMIGYANKAYSTAGISANDYMEISTSFAAGLVSACGGNTEKAADVANQAIVDMSDNANKMGTDITSIQNAYQGFAKQNYTMLDNLKLGYGGTKTEMQRLLADATKLTGVKYDINNLSDVYKAIHAIQDNLDITGTTAKEAASTFTGSFASMKAAAKNVLGKMALGENIQPALTALGETTKTFFVSNFIPMVGNLIKSLPTAIVGALNVGYDIAMTLIKNMANGFVQNVTTFVQQAGLLLVSFSAELRKKASTLVDEGMNLLLQLAQGLADALPSLIENIPTIVTNIAGCINDNGPKILATGIQIIKTLVTGLIKAIPTLIANIPKIIQAMVAVWSAFNWLNLGKNIITWIKNGIVNLKTQIPNAVKNIGNSAKNFFKNINWKELGTSLINKIISGIKSLVTAIPNALKNIGKSAMNAIKSINWIDVGKNIVSGIVNGVKNMAGTAISAIGDLGSSMLSGIKGILGIHSPSRVMRDQVGSMISLGLAKGIEKNMNPVSKAMEELSDVAMGKGLFDNSAITKQLTVNATTSTNIQKNQLNNKLGQILTFLENQQSSDRLGVYLDGKTLVGELVDEIDNRLNVKSKQVARGW